MSEDCPHCVFEKTETNCRGCFEGSNYRPTERRGRWEHINDSTRSWRFRCSECGDIAYYPVPKYHAHGCGYKFCPNCGADMKVKPQTNGDRIRGKSDYEMADWIAGILNHCDNKTPEEECLESCPLYACCNLPFDNIENWLKSPVKDGES